MEPPASDRIPPPAWAGRPPLLRVLGDRCAEAATLCALGLLAGAAGVVLAPERLVALITTMAVVAGVGAVAAPIEVSDLRRAAAEAPVAAEGPSRSADGVEYAIAAPPWRLTSALAALVASDVGSGGVEDIGHPALVGAAGLLFGLGIAACAGAGWVRRWERRERLALYLREVPVPPPDSPVTPGRAPTPEEAARLQRSMMSGQGLDDEDREILARFAADRAERASRAREEATSRRYVVVPRPGRAVTGRSTEPPPEPVATEPAPPVRR